jgi:hypothetical protein
MASPDKLASIPQKRYAHPKRTQRINQRRIESQDAYVSQAEITQKKIQKKERKAIFTPLL